MTDTAATVHTDYDHRVTRSALGLPPDTAALPEGVTVAEDAWRIDAGDDAHYGVLIRVRTITGNPYWWLICPADATLYLEQLPEAMLDCHSESCDWLNVHEKAAAVIAGHLVSEARA